VAEENKIELFDPAPTSLERSHPELVKPYDIVEAEEGPDLRAYARTIQKRRWTILSILLAVFTVVLIATLKEKPVYRATALLEIRKENPNILTVQELFQLENVSDNYLETQYRILRSETLARRVIDELHLDQAKEFSPPKDRWPWEKSTDAADAAQTRPTDPGAEQAVLRGFEAHLNVEPVPRSRLVQVSFESQDPQLAAKAVNALAATYVQENLETRWEATQKASEWLSQQLQGLKVKLEKSEDELQQYAQANGLLFLENGKGETESMVDERLRQLQDELTKAQADRYEKESLYRLVEAGDYGSLPGVLDNRLTQGLTDRLADLERQKAELVPTFTDDYPKVKQIQSQIDKIEKMLSVERKRAAQRIADGYLAALRRESLVGKGFEEQRKRANQAAARSVQYKILKREVDTNKQLYEGLLQRLKEAGVSAGLKASNIRVVDAAVPPTAPVKPRLFLNLALAFAVGMGLGVGTAFLQEHLDNTLKTPEDIERFVCVPALALIPSRESLNHRGHGVYGAAQRRSLFASGREKTDDVAGGPAKDWVRIDQDGTQYSVLSEAFRSLRTSVLLSTAGRPPRSLTFISAEAEEGKTTIASNLAISLAQLGKRVLLIDGDMRRPCVHKLFDIQDHSAGLVSYLTGQEEWHSLVQPTGMKDLDCLLCGPVPPNPSELLSSERMQALIREAMGEYQFVLVDAPPLLNVADGRILSTMVEGTVLVVKGGVTPRELVQRAEFYVRSVGGHLIGVVLNDVDLRRDGYYYSYYRYRDYGGPEDAPGES
jgi:capsular exopolysaccharide synthesis family protein